MEIVFIAEKFSFLLYFLRFCSDVIDKQANFATHVLDRKQTFYGHDRYDLSHVSDEENLGNFLCLFSRKLPQITTKLREEIFKKFDLRKVAGKYLHRNCISLRQIDCFLPEWFHNWISCLKIVNICMKNSHNMRSGEIENLERKLHSQKFVFVPLLSQTDFNILSRVRYQNNSLALATKFWISV